MKLKQTAFAALLILVLLVIAPSVRAQGSLTPPGPPGPTMKSLADIDAHIGSAAGAQRIPISSVPADINTPGSYYLTGNLSATPGIVVHVSGVTIDLNGFTLSGIGKDATGTGGGIVAQNDTVIRNGRVSDFAGDGIALGAGVLVENVDVVNIGGACIRTGEQAQVRRCRVGSGVDGIVTGDSSLVEDCTSISNTGASPHGGIVTGSYGTVTNCASSYNKGDGIVAGDGSAISRCTAFNNQGAKGGIQLHDGGVVTDCVARSNGSTSASAGIATNDAATVVHCTATANKAYGIFTGDSATVVACTSVGNLGLANNDGYGIGLRTGSHSSVSNCTVNSNKGDGIQMLRACFVTGNVAQANATTNAGGYDVHSFYRFNRIDNNLLGDHIGFYVGLASDGSDVLIRNQFVATSFISVPYDSSSVSTDSNIGPFAAPKSATNPYTNISISD